MSASKFFRTLGTVVAVVATAAVEAQANQNNRTAALNAEQSEANKWEQRRLEAHAAIQRGLERHNDTSYAYRNRTRENRAIDLRREADTNCRNRSQSLMTYTEDRIASFEKYGH